MNAETTATETVECRRCHRTLLSAASRAAGIGRWCKRLDRIEKAAVALRGVFTAEQLKKALELIGDRGVVRIGHAGVFRSVSSRGDATYLTHAQTCNCPAGLLARACYHVAAVRILTAGKAA